MRMRRLRIPVLFALAAFSTITVSSAEAAQNLQSRRFTCGYDLDTNTMRPTATIVRVTAQSPERRIRVRFRLLEDGAQIATLSGGKLQPDRVTVEEGPPQANTNEDTFVRPFNGVAFGDGGEGGP